MPASFIPDSASNSLGVFIFGWGYRMLVVGKSCDAQYQKHRKGRLDRLAKKHVHGKFKGCHEKTEHVGDPEESPG